MSGVSVSLTAHHDRYDMTVFKELDDTELPDPSIFECTLSLHGTDYQINHKVNYLPGKFEGKPK